jgi:rhodanese-related sulfurtransferase
MTNPWRYFSRTPPALGLAAAFAIAAALMMLGILVTDVNGAMAQQVIAPERALDLARDGQVMIIDIRRPDEWQKTGIPRGAERAMVRFDQGATNFLIRIAKLTNGDKTRPIALICAAGVRSKHASRLLQNRGYTQVMDISEGMLGNADGIGWLRRDLPVSRCENCE